MFFVYNLAFKFLAIFFVPHACADVFPRCCFLLSLYTKYNIAIIGNFPKTLLLVSWAKIQYARDGERPDL
jgi:hypothetical protein